VSQTYAKEIQTEAYGFGLQGLLPQRQTHLTGRLNGIDTQDWNPATFIALIKPYSAKNITGKKSVKKHLQKTFELNIDASAPLLGIVSRLAN